MRNLNRLQLRKYTPKEIEELVNKVVNRVVQLSNPEEIIVFGSAVSNQFDDQSDVDLVVIFDTAERAAAAGKILYRKPVFADRGVDYLCVDRQTYNRKSQIGGVYFVARLEGRTVYTINNFVR